MRTVTCEAERRNKQALYILENNWGSGVIDVWELARLLRGDECECPTNQPKEN